MNKKIILILLVALLFVNAVFGKAVEAVDSKVIKCNI